MNWDLLKWFAGIVITVYGLKFILDFFKGIFGPESRKELINSMGQSITKANKNLTNKISETVKKKSDERKQKKAEEAKAVVIIRQ